MDLKYNESDGQFYLHGVFVIKLDHCKLYKTFIVEYKLIVFSIWHKHVSMDSNKYPFNSYLISAFPFMGLLILHNDKYHAI